MVARKRTVKAQPLSPEVLAKLAEGLQSIHRDATTIYRGNERFAFIGIGAPAYGKFSAHAISLTRRCAANRGLETTIPGALRFKKNETLPGLIVMEPVVHFDKTQTDLYELKWYKGNTAAGIDLLPVLQPRNQVTPKGYVNEVPVTLEQLPGYNWVLVLHMENAEMRAVDSSDSEEETAVAEDHE